MINFELTVVKNNLKSNITYSVSTYDDGSFRSLNITGSLSMLDNYYTADGVDLSKELVSAEVPTTIIIRNQAMGEAIIEKCEALYTDRNNKQDLNPAISIVGQAKSLKVPGNIIIDFVTKASVDANVTLQDTSATVLANLAKPRSPLNQMANATAPANTTNNLLTRAGGFVKRYF